MPMFKVLRFTSRQVHEGANDCVPHANTLRPFVSSTLMKLWQCSSVWPLARHIAVFAGDACHVAFSRSWRCGKESLNKASLQTHTGKEKKEWIKSSFQSKKQNKTKRDEFAFALLTLLRREPDFARHRIIIANKSWLLLRETRLLSTEDLEIKGFIFIYGNLWAGFQVTLATREKLFFLLYFQNIASFLKVFSS